jgi:membrane fusion protein (multidrug efflux system)
VSQVSLLQPASEKEGFATTISAATSRRAPFSRRSAFAVATALAAAAAGTFYIILPKPSASTEAAYVEADSATVAPKVGGLVAEVLVRHNQPVKRGEPLVRINPEEFDARAAQASADLLNAQAALASAQADLISWNAEERLPPRTSGPPKRRSSRLRQ